MAVINDMQIAECTGGDTPRGDFGATLDGDRLRLPRELVRRLQTLGVFSAVQLLSYSRALPAGLATVLHWTVAEVAQAAQILEALLMTKLDERVLHPTANAPRNLGARRLPRTEN